MNLFGTVLDAPLLTAGRDVGAAIYVAAPIDTTSAAIAPIVAVGAHVAVAAEIFTLSESRAPTVVAGVTISPDTVNSTADPVAPDAVVTSAQVTVPGAIDTAADPVAPTVSTGQNIEPGTSDAVSAALAPAVGAGVLVSPGTVDASAATLTPVVAAGVQIAPNSAVDSVSEAQAPALVGAGTTVFPITSTTVARTDTTGGNLGGSNLEFATLDGPPSTHDEVILLVNRSECFSPAVLTGKNIILLAPIDTVSQAQTPDIETERRRRMVQAIAA